MHEHLSLQTSPKRQHCAIALGIIAALLFTGCATTSGTTSTTSSTTPGASPTASASTPIASPHITEFAIPTAHAQVFTIVNGPDGNLWFTELKAGQIGRITPDGTITEIPIPTANSGPASIIIGPDHNLWFTETSGGNIGQVVP